MLNCVCAFVCKYRFSVNRSEQQQRKILAILFCNVQYTIETINITSLKHGNSLAATVANKNWFSINTKQYTHNFDSFCGAKYEWWTFVNANHRVKI